MARYEYRCEECGASFEVRERMAEHEDDPSPECPECGTRETARQFDAVHLDTTDKT